ncbi:YlbF family regulator [Paenibacillus tritici]|uniref:YlbF family regulator n=1 Tax=Paenibacillus tritici TaxID=1873425 RepID=A0ABX2DR38_9BACL|nr:YlbF family regulator [Paenibacillus tritici]NQX46306.1 YlbF family regulator [Paenibacillus tritici]QUL52514.1 YlbF family regulator [Paenibacillus tritici]
MSQEEARLNEYGMQTHHTRDLIVREDIMGKAKDLAALISTSEEVRHFQQAEQKILNHERVQGLIATIKKKQKEIVAFESFKNQAMVEKIEREIEVLQDEIDSIPVVNEFQQSQSDINYLLQMVISVIRDTVSDKINVEAGTEAPPSTCGD